ncbi:MAG: IS21 family transposase [Phycisphaerales bacterium]|nr:IS21 family transposase [Phycisphaerales bacterium]
MPRPRAAMRKIREALRLCLAEGLSPRQAGIATGLPRSTVRRYVVRAVEVGLGWPLPPELDDRALEERLSGRAAPPPADQRTVPDWAVVHRELRRKGVTLQLLWTEYRAGCPDGFGYTWFTERYRAYAGRLDLVLRGDHRAGEKAFIDFAGQTIPITDPHTGEIWGAQLFVAVLGASNHTYAEALESQELPHWLGAHVRAFESWGGAPAILVPDNLRAGVTKAHRYEPVINPSYAELAAHYGTAVIPARPYKPRDKAKVEAGVLVAERWILAALRNRTFFSLAEANRAIAERVAWLNDRPFKKLEGSRSSLFAELDRPALRPLPATPYEYAVWKAAKVSIDYHVELDRHYYSVPYSLTGERVDIRASARTVEVYARGRRVASHPRSGAIGRHTTTPAHMPESHRRHLEWTPGRLVAWGEQTGPATGALMAAVLASRPHPEQGFRSCLGILRLGRRHGEARLEAACARALAVGALSYRSVDSILRSGLERAPMPEPPPVRATRTHANVRGPAAYE